MDKKFVKLSELDGDTFTVTETHKYVFKKWDESSRKMLVEESWNDTMKGDRNWRKIFPVDTSEGRLDLSEKQLKDMLSGVYFNGIADINNRTFTVKKYVGDNDIPTYYINPTKDAPKKSDEADVTDEELEALGW